jgi:glutamate 5-kinase
MKIMGVPLAKGEALSRGEFFWELVLKKRRFRGEKRKSFMKVVIKVGSAVLTDGDSLAYDRLKSLVEFIALLQNEHDVMLVSSGAVAAGYTELPLDRRNVANRQALAAIGQPHLLTAYQKKFAMFGRKCAQLLLTKDDFDSRSRTKTAKRAVEALLKNGVIPVINENDVTATEELVFGDNDQLSAHVTHYFDADLLIILSDIDAYYDDDPRKNSAAKAHRIVEHIGDEDLMHNYNPNNLFATGGIVTKLKAAQFLLHHGKSMFLASGFDLQDVHGFMLENNQRGGTLFRKGEL